MTVIDPKTGERLFMHPKDGKTPLESHEDFASAIGWIEERMAPLYRVRRNLREEMAARFPPAAMPKARRDRTDAQLKVERCPRCGGRLESEGADSK